jgi:hypothetical protein
METDASTEPKNGTDKLKDCWDKWHIIANSIAVLLIPTLVGFFGYQINAAVKDKEISQKYVELAIGILKGDPDKESPALLEWAINIVNANSPVKIDPKVREELKKKPLRTVRAISPKTPSTTSSMKILTDEKGNPLTDENGNILTTEGPATSGSQIMTYDNGQPITYDNGEPVTVGRNPSSGKGK